MILMGDFFHEALCWGEDAEIMGFISFDLFEFLRVESA